MLTGGAAVLRRFASPELRRCRTSAFPSASITTSIGDDDLSQTAGISSPPPIRVALTDSAGRGVFATRRIDAGELIHTAKPLVSHPSLPLSHRVCYYCLGNVPIYSDSSSCCFCSRRCRSHSEVFYEVERKADWLLYEDYCRARGLKYPLMVKRLACMVISGAASADSLYILQPASLHPEMILEHFS